MTFCVVSRPPIRNLDGSMQHIPLGGDWEEENDLPHIIFFMLVCDCHCQVVVQSCSCYCDYNFRCDQSIIAFVATVVVLKQCFLTNSGCTKPSVLFLFQVSNFCRLCLSWLP